MRFEAFIRQKKVRKGKPDIQLARSLVKMSDNHIESINDVKLTKVSSATIMTTYYESLREIVEAMAAVEGFKVYSHEAFTYFLKEREEDIISFKFDKYRKIRNNINYYGEPIESSVTEAGIKDMLEMIAKLKDKFLKSI